MGEAPPDKVRYRDGADEDVETSAVVADLTDGKPDLFG